MNKIQYYYKSSNYAPCLAHMRSHKLCKVIAIQLKCLASVQVSLIELIINSINIYYNWDWEEVPEEERKERDEENGARIAEVKW